MHLLGLVKNGKHINTKCMEVWVVDTHVWEISTGNASTLLETSYSNKALCKTGLFAILRNRFLNLLINFAEGTNLSTVELLKLLFFLIIGLRNHIQFHGARMSNIDLYSHFLKPNFSGIQGEQPKYIPHPPI